LKERFDQRLGGVERTMLNIQMTMDGIMERLPPARPVGRGRYAAVNNLGGHLPLAADVLVTPAAPAVRMHHQQTSHWLILGLGGIIGTIFVN